MKYVKEHINEVFTDETDPIKDLNIGLTPKKIFKDFEIKLIEEFPDLQDIRLDEDNNCIVMSMDEYTELGMNALDDAIKKIIRKYFKKILVKLDESNWNKYGMSDEDYSEEDIFIKIII